MNKKMDLGGAIKECRLRRGLQRWDVGVEVGIKTRTVAAYEEGKEIPTEDTLRSIAAALGVPFEMLLFLAADTETLGGTDKSLAKALKKTALDLLGAIKPEKGDARG